VEGDGNPPIGCPEDAVQSWKFAARLAADQGGRSRWVIKSRPLGNDRFWESGRSWAEGYLPAPEPPHGRIAMLQRTPNAKFDELKKKKAALEQDLWIGSHSGGEVPLT
jgi:hypothetical protein